MPKPNKIWLVSLFLLVSVFGSSAYGSARASVQKKHKAEKAEKAEEEGADDGTPVMWTDPGNIESFDMFYGIGGKEGAPNPSDKFTFVRRSTHGTSKKIIVKDSEGREWTVKFGPEARPETTASRIVWAMGYHTDEDYYVTHAQIDGWDENGGNVTDVRFERRKDGFKDYGNWDWNSNPFLGKRDLDGLKVLMALLNNWDLKTDNNKIIRPTKKSGGDRDERIYYVSDLGATYGATGSTTRKILFFTDAPAGTKDKPEAYAHQRFVKGTHSGFVNFNYKGKDRSTMKDVEVANAKWMGGMLARLSDKQLADSFRCAGYNDSEVSLLVNAMKERIRELQELR